MHLQICASGYDDFTAGHPTPLKTAKPNDAANYPTVTSLEMVTSEGFFSIAMVGFVGARLHAYWNGMEWTHHSHRLDLSLSLDLGTSVGMLGDYATGDTIGRDGNVVGSYLDLA